MAFRIYSIREPSSAADRRRPQLNSVAEAEGKLGH